MRVLGQRGARLAAVGTSLALAAGCGGDSGNSGDAGSGPPSSTGATGTETETGESRTARVEQALKAHLEAGIALFGVRSVDCTPRDANFDCRAQGVKTGRLVKGRLRLVSQAVPGAGAEGGLFTTSGRLRGRGAEIGVPQLVIDLSRPLPPKPPGERGRSALEQEVELSIEALNPLLSIGRIRCPEPEGARGSKFTCRAQGSLGPNAARIEIEATQLDRASKRFRLRGEIGQDPRGERLATFQKVTVDVP